MQNYCNNCGNFGHTYNNCRHPILSYGVVLFHIDNSGICRIVMVERKDSLSFIEFLRGKYKTPLNRDYIKLLVSRMTVEEKKRLLNHSFEDLWRELWIHTDNINDRIKKEYQNSKVIFEELIKGIQNKQDKYSLETIIKECPNNYILNEWEIPKGRREGYENNKDCALREFYEETNINRDKYKLINNIIPLIEEYRGINNVRYKHIYYVGEINEEIQLFINHENKEQYTEIKDIQWLTEDECYEKIRDYDDHKKKIVRDFFHFQKNASECIIMKNVG